MPPSPLKQITLPNKMRLVTVPMPGVQSLTVLAMVGIGSRFEAKAHAGISHFLEHLPFKGTHNYPTSIDIASTIDGVGGKHNAFTGKEYTGYWVKVAGRHWRLALDVVSDLLLTAKLRPKDIQREKGVIIEEINMYEDQPQAKVSDLFDDLVFKGSPLSRPVIGYKDTVSTITQADFKAHQDAWYHPENIVIGVVGSIPGEEKAFLNSENFIEAVTGYFNKGGQKTGSGKRSHGIKPQQKPRHTVFYKDTEQAHFHLGFPGISRDHDDRYTLAVLTTLLGGNSSSRLFNEIREKRGLAYYAYASADLYQDAGSVYALEGVTIGKIEEAIKVTLEQFQLARRSLDISQAEVDRAIEYVTGKTVLDVEDSSSLANFVVRRALLDGRAETVESVLKKIRAVTRDQVEDLAKRLFDPQKLNLSVVGPFKDSTKFSKLIEH